MHNYLISLGSNMGDRRLHIQNAVRSLEHAGLKIERISGLFESEPWGTSTGQSFYNICLTAEYQYDPIFLLNLSIKIEQESGRTRSIRNAPRTLDLDLILADDLVISTSELVLPHPRMEQRKFVLVPAKQIAPDWIHPVAKKTVAQLLDECTDNSWVRQLEGRITPS